MSRTLIRELISRNYTGEPVLKQTPQFRMESSEPLPDDVTAQELAARPKQPKPARKRASTEAYEKTAGKWWPRFLKSAGWDGTIKGVFIDEDGTPKDGTFRQLFIWLYEQDVTKGVFKPMLAWAQARLNEQLVAKILMQYRLTIYDEAVHIIYG